MTSLRRFIGLVLSIALGMQPLYGANSPVPAAGTTAAASANAAAETSAIAKANMPENISMTQIALPKTLISVDFQDTDVRDVLHMLALKSNMNIIYGNDILGTITLHLDKVPFDQAFQTVLTLKGYVALRLGPRIIRVITSGELNQEESQATAFTRVFQLNYAAAADVKTQLDAIRNAAGRKGVSTVDSKTNSIILTDTQEGLKEAEYLIPSLDRKPQEVDIEAKIVEVTLNDQTTMGITWGYARSAGGGNSYGSSTQQTSNTGPGTSGQIGGVVTTPNVPSGSGNTSTSGSTTGSASSVGALGVALADTSQIAFSFLHGDAANLLSIQLSALAIKNKLKVLSNPHIVTMNNEEATIEVADQEPYQVVSQTAVGTQVGFQFVNAGVKLTVRPTINADRRITLKVRPEVSSPGAAPFTGAPPVINTRNANTTVLLRDGETLAIGGLITESTQKIVTGIPILMSIPFLGALFRSKQDIKQRTELIVLLTPKISVE
jgi:type IV pilus assembly protein PilQ